LPAGKKNGTPLMSNNNTLNNSLDNNSEYYSLSYWSDPSINISSSGEGSNTVEVQGRMVDNFQTPANNRSVASSSAPSNALGNGSGTSILGGVSNNNNNNRSLGGSNSSGRYSLPPPITQQQLGSTRSAAMAVLPFSVSLQSNRHTPLPQLTSQSVASASRTVRANGRSVTSAPPAINFINYNRGFSTASQSQFSWEGGGSGSGGIPHTVYSGVPPPPPRQRHQSARHHSGVPPPPPRPEHQSARHHNDNASITSSLQGSLPSLGIDGAAMARTRLRDRMLAEGLPTVREDKFDSMFDQDEPIPAEEIMEANVLILPREDRGDPGTSTFIKNERRATQGITHAIGVATFLRTTQFGDEDGNDTKKRWIQDTTLTNNIKLKEFNLHLKQFDFDRLFWVYKIRHDINIDEYVDPEKSMKSVFDRSVAPTHAVEQWSELTLNEVCIHQLALNKHNKSDKVGESWSLQFIKASTTLDLQAQVEREYDKLHPLYRGPVTYMWLVMKEVFGSTRETTKSLQKYLELCEQRGLGLKVGENVNQYATEAKAVVEKLAADGELRSESTRGIVTGLCICSNPQFKKLMDNYLLEIDKHDLEVNDGFMWGQPDTKGEIFHILDKAVIKYKSLSKAGEWVPPVKGGAKFGSVSNVPGAGWANGQVCFNCGESGHVVSACPKPFNKKEFERRRDEYYKKKREAGNDKNASSPGYNRGKPWGKPKTGEPTIKLFKGKTYCFCPKCKDGDGAWVDDHSSGLHAKAMSTPGWTKESIDNDQHPLFTFGNGKSKSKKSKKSKGTESDSSGGGNDDNIDKTFAAATLKKFKNSASTPETERMVEEMGKAFKLSDF